MVRSLRAGSGASPSSAGRHGPVRAPGAPPGTRAELWRRLRRDLHALAERVARIEGALTGPWPQPTARRRRHPKTPPDARSAGTAGRGGVPERLSGNLTYPGESPPRSADVAETGIYWSMRQQIR